MKVKSPAWLAIGAIHIQLSFIRRRLLFASSIYSCDANELPLSADNVLESIEFNPPKQPFRLVRDMSMSKELKYRLKEST